MILSAGTARMRRAFNRRGMSSILGMDAPYAVMARIMLRRVSSASPRLSHARPIAMPDTAPSLATEHGAEGRDGPAMAEENCSA